MFYPITERWDIEAKRIVLSVFFALSGPLTFVILAQYYESFLHNLIFPAAPTDVWFWFYFGTHTWYRLLLLATVGAYFLRVLKIFRRVLLVPWQKVTPPFNIDLKVRNEEVSKEIIEKAGQIGFGGIIIGYVISLYIVSIWRFSPQGRHGSVGNPTAPFGLPTGILQYFEELPLVDDLIVLSGYIFSPTTFGYLLLTIPFSVLLVGMWNLIHIFSNREKALVETESLMFESFVRWTPYFGIALVFSYLVTELI